MEKTEVEDSGRKKEPAATEVAPETTESTEAKEAYEFHIRLHGENIDQKLKDAATIAHGLDLIPKATLANPMSLFIGWGLSILKQQWLEKVGYR